MSNHNARFMFILNISILIVIALIVYAVVKIQRINRIVSTSSQENVDIATFVFAGILDSSVEYEGSSINQQTFLKYVYKSGLEDQPILVVRYSSFTCRSCMNYISDVLCAMIPDAISHNRVVYVESECINNSNKFGTTLFLPQGETFGWEIEETREPLIFVYDGSVKHLFIADVQYPKLLNSYLSAVQKRYSF